MDGWINGWMDGWINHKSKNADESLVECCR